MKQDVKYLNKIDAGRVLRIAASCFNEEEALAVSPEMLLCQFQEFIAVGPASNEDRFCFVGDGSTDRTQEIICSFVVCDSHYSSS